MSTPITYTTGEIARLCGVTVRTVQYYDTRSLLVPTATTEGGRRLYSEEDVRRLHIICYLRELGLSIDAISGLLREAHPETVIDALLDEQEHTLRAELLEQQARLNRLADLRRELRGIEPFSVESIGDVVHLIAHRQRLRRMRIAITAVGMGMDLVDITTALVWLLTGNWIPFAVGMPFVLLAGIGISAVYFNRTAYICPACHAVFHPTFGESFWAPHTPRTRTLTCPRCHRKGSCVETYRAPDEP